MTIGLVGRKRGMTRIFTDAGETVPVTVIEALPNRVVQVKAEKPDGYRAVQVTVGARRASVDRHFNCAHGAPLRTSRIWPGRRR